MGTREKLPNRRRSEGLNAKILGMEVIVQFGYNEEGRIREIFVDPVRFGSTVNTTLKDLAVLFSFLLQYGCQIEEIDDVLQSDTYGNPEGAAGQLAKLIKENDHDVPTET